MDTIPIRFTFDYVDPGSYLADAALRRWRRRKGVELAIEWSPLELRVPGTDPVSAEDPGWMAMAEAMRAEAEHIGTEFDPPARVPFTRKAHELALHAHEKGCFEGVHRALFEAHFARGLDIGRVDVLVGLGESQGLDPSETRTVLGVDRFLPRVEVIRADALGHGIRGVPTLEVEGRRLEGFESHDALEAFLDRVRDELATRDVDQNR